MLIFPSDNKFVKSVVFLLGFVTLPDVLKDFINEERAIVRALKYSLLLRFPVHLGEQFGFLFVGGRNLLDGSREEPAPPPFAGRGELAVGGAVPLIGTFVYVTVHNHFYNLSTNSIKHYLCVELNLFVYD